MLARLFQAYADIFSIATFQPARPAAKFGEDEPVCRPDRLTNSLPWTARPRRETAVDAPELPRAA
jgi:hypothetical protein